MEPGMPVRLKQAHRQEKQMLRCFLRKNYGVTGKKQPGIQAEKQPEMQETGRNSRLVQEQLQAGKLCGNRKR